jgi:hypothetical protein
MKISYIDIVIFTTYFVITVGFIVSKGARKNLNLYLLSNKKLPWYLYGQDMTCF